MMKELPGKVVAILAEQRVIHSKAQVLAEIISEFGEPWNDDLRGSKALIRIDGIMKNKMRALTDRNDVIMQELEDVYPEGERK